jgi:tRNA pseudouridine55 synthase
MAKTGKPQRRQERIHWRAVSGILLLDKPRGISSNAALQRVRRIFRAAKGGHTGSLDPLATGLLPICLGEATKIAGLLLGSRKAYETECRLGQTTDSADADGAVVDERPVPPLDAQRIEAALLPLRGRIRQVPPIYSALKRDGEPLYRLARRGEHVEVEARDALVHRFELIAMQGDRLRLHVECASGTYVRSLVRDLGDALGCGAHVTALRRLWVEPFTAPHMLDLPALESLAAGNDLAALDGVLLPIEAGLGGYAVVDLDDDAARRLRQGQAVVVASGVRGPCLARDALGVAVAFAEIDAHGTMRCVRGFNPD